MEKNKDHVEQVWTVEDIDRITKQGKLAAMLTVEGAACLNGKIEKGTYVVYAYFGDGEGIILSRMDGR